MLEKNDIFFMIDEETKTFSTWFVNDFYSGSYGDILYSVSKLDDNNSILETYYFKDSEIFELENSNKLIDRNSFVKNKNEVMKYISNKSTSLDNDNMSKE